MKRGFTLMELLIVIAIIGILTSIAMASYGTVQKRSRDSRRIGDMKSIQNGWEQYFADNSSTYPGPVPTTDNPNPSVPCTLDLMSSSTTYLPGGYPKDPIKNIAYPDLYDDWSRCESDAYCFCAGVEIAANGNSAKGCASGDIPADYQGLYCVRNLQ